MDFPMDRAHPEGWGLAWSVKDSLLAYVARLPDGVVAVEAGAAFTADRQVHFPLVHARVGEIASTDMTIEFGGSITLSGHEGMLHIAVEQPIVIIDGAAVELTGVDALTGIRVGIARGTIDTRREDDTGLSIRTSHMPLEESGMELFAHQYPAGTALSPLLLRIPRSVSP